MDLCLCLCLIGPILLEDYHLVEKIAQFDRERIPERVVHARGASAKGFFEVTHDISHLTCADFMRAPGVQTPVIVRFSTVIHERGSPETLRDPRGFAVKFYTREVSLWFHCLPYGRLLCCNFFLKLLSSSLPFYYFNLWENDSIYFWFILRFKLDIINQNNNLIVNSFG